MTGSVGAGDGEQSAPIHVLHVDDDDALLDLAATFLEREDDRLSVVSESDPRAALGRLSTESVDCVVSDYQMPRMDGLDFLEAVRGSHPDLPFILFTGRGSEEIASDAISAGVTDYLQKGGTERYTVLANRIANTVEQSRATRQLQRKTDLFEKTQRLATVGGWEYGVQDESLRWTNEVLRILDLPLDYQPSADDVLDFYHPDDRDEVSDAVERAVARGESFEIEVRVITADDRLRWVQARGEPQSVDGEVVRIRGSVQDVTERKESERRLEALHGATRELLRAETTEAVAEITTRAAKDVLGHPYCVLRLLADDGRTLEPVACTTEITDRFGERPAYEIDDGGPAEAYRRGETVVYRSVSEIDDGHDRSAFGSAMYLPLGDHGVLSISHERSSGFDDTDVRMASVLAANADAVLTRVEQSQRLRDRERTLTERTEQLEEARTQLELSLIASNAGMWEYDLASRTVHRHETMERLLGLDPGFFDEDPDEFLERVHPDYRELVRTTYEESNATAESFQMQFPVRDGDGTYRWVEERGEVRDDGADDQPSLIGTITDISEQKRREQELESKVEQLEAIVSALAGDQLASDPEPIDVAVATRSAWERVGPDDASLTVGDAGTVLADEGALVWLLEYLLENAVEHGSTSSQRADSAAARSDGAGVSITVGRIGPDRNSPGESTAGRGFYVADDGPGIPPAERETVFDPEYTTSGTGTGTVTGTGLGLGLPCVRRIASAHGWTVRVTESESGGARFEVVGVET